MMNKKPKIIRAQLIDEAGRLLPARAMNIDDYRFPPRQREQLSHVQQTRANDLFQRVGRFFQGMTPERWNDAFLRDTDPNLRLAGWESVAEVFESDIGRQELWDDSRRVHAIADIRSDVVDAGGHHGISDELVARIRVALGGLTKEGARISHKPPSLPPRVMTHIEDLSKAFTGNWRDRDEPLLDLVDEADAVVAVDCKSGEECLVYGCGVFDAALRGDPEWAGRSPKALTVALDMSEKMFDLPLLRVICEKVKGPEPEEQNC